MSTRARGLRWPIGATLVALIAACASGPVPPDWQANAKDATDRALAAYLKGDTRVADAEFARARSEVARTGRVSLLARVELMQCAARVASLDLGPCEGFERLRSDAPAAERAYADYLAGRIRPQDVALLPAAQRALADPSLRPESAPAALREIGDPLSRLVAVAVLFQSGRANPAALTVALDTASEQGWRRPLLAWLNVEVMRAEKAGDAAAVEQLRRRIRVVEQAK